MSSADLSTADLPINTFQTDLSTADLSAFTILSSAYLSIADLSTISHLCVHCLPVNRLPVCLPSPMCPLYTSIVITVCCRPVYRRPAHHHASMCPLRNCLPPTCLSALTYVSTVYRRPVYSNCYKCLLSTCLPPTCSPSFICVSAADLSTAHFHICHLSTTFSLYGFLLIFPSHITDYLRKISKQSRNMSE